jgi:dolichyl-phosphate-mannose-protein mannosyltransferase
MPALPAALRNPALQAGLGVFVVGLVAFSIGITAPDEPYFDETWYVPAARTLLSTGEMLRQEHPPLAKLLIAFGMMIFGDNSFGWRAMPCLFGAAALAGLYAWTVAMTRSWAWGLYAAALGLVGGVLYVQARIAMLDVFLMAFGLWALTYFTLSLEDGLDAGRSFGRLSAAGLFLGLATASKVSGAFLWVGLGAVAVMIALLRGWGAQLAEPRGTDFYGPGRWQGLGLADALIALLLVPLVAYSATYLQQIIHAGQIRELIDSHVRMREILTGDPGTHPYSSPWWRWPLLLRPVWYYFKIPGGDADTWSDDFPAVGVMGLPNPPLTWLGEIAIFVALVRWMRTRDLACLMVATAFFAQFLPWIIDPKGLEFSFYFFPSLLAIPAAFAVLFAAIPMRALSLGLAGALLLVSLVAFIFFLPFLSAAIGGLTPSVFEARIWLPGWR